MCLLLVLLALAAPRPATGGCPSKLGPGRHSVALWLPDAADPSVVWSRGLEVVVAVGMARSTPRPAVVMWHGCGSDPEKFQEESGTGLLIQGVLGTPSRTGLGVGPSL
jgi:hypothetical protein